MTKKTIIVLAILAVVLITLASIVLLQNFVSRADGTKFDAAVTYPDLTQANLQLSDLPRDFAELSSDELALVGIDSKEVADAYSNNVAGLKLQSYFAARSDIDITDPYGYPARFRVIESYLFAPLADQASVDQADTLMHDPKRTAALLPDLQLETPIQILSDVQPIGNISIAFDAISRSGFRMEIVNARQDSVWIVVRTFQIEPGRDITFGADNLARIVDKRVSTIFGKGAH